MHANTVLLIVIAALIVVLLLWLLAASRRTRVEREGPAVDEPARRNQALIDAPPASATPPAAYAAPVAVPVIADAVAPAVPVPAAVAPSEGDDLTRLKGVGPRLADQLRALGVTRFGQIAQWDDADVDRIDAQLGRFQGRIRRDDWREQARLLAAGDTAAYETRFGRL